MYERVMRRNAGDTAATRAAVLEAALFVFAEQGVARATLAGVAGRAGLTRGAVYHHFADKPALHAAVLDETWDVIAAPVWAVLDGPDVRRAPLSTRLSAFAAAWLGALRCDRRFQALMTVSVYAGASSAADDPASTSEETVAGFMAWRNRLTVALTEGRAELAANVDPQVAAIHLLSWLCGTALLASVDPELLPPADAHGVAPTLRGLLA